MIQLIDKVAPDQLQKSIVKPDSLVKACLVQSTELSEDLFALLMVDDQRAVLVAGGGMTLAAHATANGTGTHRLQTFRNQIDRIGIRTKELRFCQPGSLERSLQAVAFDPAWFVPASAPELVERFVSWRAGKATW